MKVLIGLYVLEVVLRSQACKRVDYTAMVVKYIRCYCLRNSAKPKLLPQRRHWLSSPTAACLPRPSVVKLKGWVHCEVAPHDSARDSEGSTSMAGLSPTWSPPACTERGPRGTFAPCSATSSKEGLRALGCHSPSPLSVPVCLAATGADRGPSESSFQCCESRQALDPGPQWCSPEEECE